jgi:hypothetical protein
LGNLPWRRWGLQMCTSIPGSTKLPEPKK